MGATRHDTVVRLRRLPVLLALQLARFNERSGCPELAAAGSCCFGVLPTNLGKGLPRIGLFDPCVFSSRFLFAVVERLVLPVVYAGGDNLVDAARPVERLLGNLGNRRRVLQRALLCPPSWFLKGNTRSIVPLPLILLVLLLPP